MKRSQEQGHKSGDDILIFSLVATISIGLTGIVNPNDFMTPFLKVIFAILFLGVPIIYGWVMAKSALWKVVLLIFTGFYLFISRSFVSGYMAKEERINKIQGFINSGKIVADCITNDNMPSQEALSQYENWRNSVWPFLETIGFEERLRWQSIHSDPSIAFSGIKRKELQGSFDDFCKRIIYLGDLKKR